MNVGQRIKELRKQSKLDQSQLAAKLNVSNKTVSSWEQNRTQPKMEMIEAMCKIFNCTKADFVTDYDIGMTIDGTEVVIESPLPHYDASAHYVEPISHEVLTQKMTAIIDNCSSAQLKLITDFAELVVKNNYLSNEDKSI